MYCNLGFYKTFSWFQFLGIINNIELIILVQIIILLGWTSRRETGESKELPSFKYPEHCPPTLQNVYSPSN